MRVHRSARLQLAAAVPAWRRAETKRVSSKMSDEQNQVLDHPGVIRWAVGHPTGPRSNTWSVIGHTNSDDVFIRLRDHLGHMKLSLHKAKTWSQYQVCRCVIFSR